MKRLESIALLLGVAFIVCVDHLAAQSTTVASFLSLDYNKTEVALDVFDKYDDLVQVQHSLINDGTAVYARSEGFPVDHAGFFPIDYQVFLNTVVLPEPTTNAPYLESYYDLEDCPGWGYAASSPFAESRYLKYVTTHSQTSNKEIALQVTSFNSWKDSQGCWIQTSISSVYWEVP